MYAVIETGGKQYKVQSGDVIQVEKLDGEVGSALKFGQVLMVSKGGADRSTIWLGKPYLGGAVVEGDVVGQGRGEKILIIKMKRRKQYRRTQGHRQNYTQILVTSVDNGAGEKVTLSAADKKAKISSFMSQLKPKGPAFSPKILGSRVRLAAKAKADAKAKPAAKTKSA